MRDELEVEKGVECYERVKGGKNGSPVPIFLPHGDPISKALTEKSLLTRFAGDHRYGRTEASTTRFPYSFPTVFSFWSEASSAINFIAAKAGGKDKLKGLRSRPSITTRPTARRRRSPSRSWPRLRLRGHPDPGAASGQ